MASQEISGIAAVGANSGNQYAQQLADAATKKAVEAQQRTGREEALETQSAKAAEAGSSASSNTQQQHSSKIDLTA